jgi:hypothetical protein
MIRIKHNDLTHYFLRQHSDAASIGLPEASCQKFFKELGNERQATGAKLQATSCKKILRRVGTRVKNRFNRKI